MRVSITPQQVRAARAMLNWSRDDLAAASGVHKDSILRTENGSSQPQHDTLEKLVATFSDHNVVFTEDGVRQRRDAFREISPPDAYMKLLDDAFLTLKDTGGEVLFFYIDNSVSSPAVIDTANRMRHNGIKFRALINEDNPYFLFPLKEYRLVPKELFHNNPILVYGDKVGTLLDPPTGHSVNSSSCYIVRHSSNANAMRLIFEALWRQYKMPKETTAPVTYD
jgi:DNA-binding XRE family transcriptional regulator